MLLFQQGLAVVELSKPQIILALSSWSTFEQTSPPTSRTKLAVLLFCLKVEGWMNEPCNGTKKISRRNWVTGQDVHGSVWKDQRLDTSTMIFGNLNCHISKETNKLTFGPNWNAFTSMVIQSRNSQPGSSCVFPEKCWVQALSLSNLTSDTHLDLSSVSIRYPDRFQQTTGGASRKTLFMLRRVVSCAKTEKPSRGGRLSLPCPDGCLIIFQKGWSADSQLVLIAANEKFKPFLNIC